MNWRKPAIGLAVLLAAAAAVPAHEFTITEVEAVFPGDGTYRVDMRVDVDALALGVSPSVPSTEIAAVLEAMDEEERAAAAGRAERTLLRRVRIRFDQTKQVPIVTFPEEGMPAGPDDEPTVLGTLARLSGDVPEGAAAFSFGASRAFGPVQLTVGGATHVLVPGEQSPDLLIGRVNPAPSRLRVAGRYVLLGFEHILPFGLDHILFVLGLFLLSTRWGPLLWQVSAFTLAHTLTLALAVMGVVSLPSRLVETLIALSIAWVAIENIVVREMTPWRPVVVFAFGLLHGLGFAGVLRDLGLPRGRLVTALLSFNVGVELGQLAVIVIAFVLVGRYRRDERYRSRVVVPASAVIAAVGLYWTVQRGL